MDQDQSIDVAVAVPPTLLLQALFHRRPPFLRLFVLGPPVIQLAGSSSMQQAHFRFLSDILHSVSVPHLSIELKCLIICRLDRGNELLEYGDGVYLSVSTPAHTSVYRF